MALRKNSQNHKGQVLPSVLSSCLILFKWTWILGEMRMTAVLRELKTSSDIENFWRKQILSIVGQQRKSCYKNY